MEFEEVMGAIKEKAEAMLQPAMAAAGGKPKIMYSWDNDKIHAGADLERVGITSSMRLELPPLSSDMHKVIEHVHAQVQRKFDDWLWDYEGQGPTAQECMDQVEAIFRQQITTESIFRDVHSLHATYAAIIAAEGGYPAPKFR